MKRPQIFLLIFQVFVFLFAIWFLFETPIFDGINLPKLDNSKLHNSKSDNEESQSIWNNGEYQFPDICELFLIVVICVVAMSIISYGLFITLSIRDSSISKENIK